MIAFLQKIDREAAWESGRNVFAVLGVGATLGNIGAMHLWLMLPATALVGAAWLGMYRLYL